MDSVVSSFIFVPSWLALIGPSALAAFLLFHPPRTTQGVFRWDIGEKFLLERPGKYWTRLSREGLDSLSLEGFKSHVEVAPGDVV